MNFLIHTNQIQNILNNLVKVQTQYGHPIIEILKSLPQATQSCNGIPEVPPQEPVPPVVPPQE